VEKYNRTWYWAEYKSFVVLSEAYNYRLMVSGYSGNAGDQMRYHNTMMFSTYDRDNDVRPERNCAVSIGGGFWNKRCAVVRINGAGDNFYWQASTLLITRPILHLQTSRMWLTC